MLRKLRDYVTLIVFGILLAISLAAGFETARQGFPAPVSISPGERLRWLGEHDIRNEPRDVKLRLADRLEDDFSHNLDWQAEVAQFNDKQWKLFDANFDELMRLWFLQKVDTWASLAEEERDLYLDDQLRYLMSWKPITRETANVQPGRKRRRQGMQFTAVAQKMHRWTENEPPAQRARIEDFVQSVTQHVIKRMTNPVQMGQSFD